MSAGWLPGSTVLGSEGRRGLAGMVTILGPYWRPFGLSLVCALLNQGLALAATAVGAYLVARAVLGATVAELWPLVWLMVGAVIGRAIFQWLEAWVSHDLAFRLLAEIRVAVYRAIERIAPGGLLRRRSGDLSSTAMADSERLELLYAHTLLNLVVAVVIPGAALAVLAAFHPALAFVLLPALGGMAVAPVLLRRVAARQGRVLRARTAEVNAEVVDAVQGLREIVAFGRERERLQRLDHHGAELVAVQRRYALRGGGEIAVTTTLTALGMLAVLVVGARLVAVGDLDATLFPVAVVLAANAVAPITSFIANAKDLGNLAAAANRVFDLLDEPAPVPDAGTAPVEDLEPRVRFERVTFRYSRDAQAALDDVSFEIAPGETVALVGHSGAGKSTCAHLLLRFWDPDSGRITIGGTDLRALPQEGLRSLIAAVPQDVFLFHDSVAVNVRLARPDATEAEVQDVARLALADEFIAELPDGYGTVVGDRGARLSGGQRQRLAIARALLKDTPILVFDESVSMLDAVSESRLRAATEHARRGRTTLVIAHRLSTIRAADRIVLLERGRVLATGTHEELLAACPAYVHLLGSQHVLTDPPPAPAISERR